MPDLINSRTQRRSDVSGGLIHLIKDVIEVEDPFAATGSTPRKITPAFDILKTILNSGVINAGFGFVKGPRPVVCMSEIPLSSVHAFASPPEQETARYRFYGFVFSKSCIFQLGGRPVIYLPDDEGAWIPSDQRWRHVRFEPPGIDWTNEREWRVPVNINLADTPGFYVLVWTNAEATELRSFEFEQMGKLRGIIPMHDLSTFL